MKKIYNSNGNYYKIYNKDCLIQMKKIKDKSIDCIITDIPYGVNFKKIKGDDTDLVIKNMPLLFKTYYRILKDNTCLFLFTGIKNIHHWIINAENNGFYFKNIIATRSFNNGSAVSNNFAFHLQPILFFTKGNPKLNKVDFFKTSKEWLNDKRNKNKKEFTYIYSNFITTDTCYGTEITSTNSLHPNQKNLKLLEFLVKISTKENNLVLDMFMGSGSTGVACINTKRNFIGIELDKKYYKIAKKRLEENIISLF